MWFGLGIIPLFLLLDTIQGARTYDSPKYAKLLGLAVTVCAVGLSFLIAGFWGEVFAGVGLFDNSDLGTLEGALFGLLVYQLAHYWYHRTAHAYDWLWRLTHQMHHSAEQLDSFSAHYLHPLDVFAFTTMGSLVYFPLLGLPLEAGLWAAAFNGFSAMFQHANINTPHWLGYFIQRPESHGIHHERGSHNYNFADLPLMDMIFGTLRNPEKGAFREAGFYNGGSRRIGEMLLFRDVSGPEESPLASRPGKRFGTAERSEKAA